MSTRSFIIITFIGLVTIFANGIKSTMNLASYFKEKPDALATTSIESEMEYKSQQRMAYYVANNPRHGCIPQPAFIHFDLAKHGEWIKLETIKDLQDEDDRQWGLLNCEGLVLVK